MSELYELPEGWEWSEWKNIINIKNGKNYKEVLNPNGLYPIYGSGGIINYADKYLCNEDSTIIGRKGTINNPIFIKEKFWNIDTAFGLEANIDKLLPLFLYYFTLNFNFLILNKSTTLPSLAKSNLQTILMPLPPLSEQQRIVSKLDLLFEKIDKSIALHQKNMDEANVFMGSVLNDVFGDLEEKYATKTVDEVSLNVRYGYTDSAKDKGNAVFIRITDINENGKFKDNFVYVDIEDKELEKFKLYKGDILVARSGATAGKVALFDLDFVSVFASYLIRIQPNNEMDSSFFFYFCHSPKYWEQLNVIKVGGAQPNVNATNLKQLKIATPPLNIQQKTVKYLDEISEKIEKIKQAQKAKMNSLKALKASILDQAFKGEL